MDRVPHNVAEMLQEMNEGCGNDDQDGEEEFGYAVKRVNKVIHEVDQECHGAHGGLLRRPGIIT